MSTKTEIEDFKKGIISFYETYLKSQPTGITFLNLNEKQLTERINVLKTLPHLIGYKLELEKAKFELRYIKKLKSKKATAKPKTTVKKKTVSKKK